MSFPTSFSYGDRMMKSGAEHLRVRTNRFEPAGTAIFLVMGRPITDRIVSMFTNRPRPDRRLWSISSHEAVAPRSVEISHLVAAHMTGPTAADLG